MLKKYELNAFSYTSVGDKPKTTEREAFVISMPSDSYYVLELSEFNTKDKEYYVAALRDFYLDRQEQEQEFLREIGLNQNFRRMKQDGCHE